MVGETWFGDKMPALTELTATSGQALMDSALQLCGEKLGVIRPALPFFFLQCVVEERGKLDEKPHFENGVCNVHLRYTFREQVIWFIACPLLVATISQVMIYDTQVSSGLEDDEKVSHPHFCLALNYCLEESYRCFERHSKVFKVILRKITGVPQVEGPSSIFAHIKFSGMKQAEKKQPVRITRVNLSYRIITTFCFAFLTVRIPYDKTMHAALFETLFLRAITFQTSQKSDSGGKTPHLDC